MYYLRILKLTVRLEVVRVVPCWHHMEEHANHHNDECPERIKNNYCKNVDGKSKDECIHKDRTAETERNEREEKTARETDGGSTDGRTRREERGAANVPGPSDVPREPWER